MDINDVTITEKENCSRELVSIIERVLKQIQTDGISTDPNDASAYWLLNQLTDGEEIVQEFVSEWQNHDMSGMPNGGNHRLYYLADLHNRYGERPISEVVREIGLLEQFREAQFRSGRLQISESSTHHGLGFRGLVAIAPDAEATRAAIGNITRRHKRSHLPREDRIMSTSALGLLEHNYEKYQPVVDAVTERVAENVQRDIQSRADSKYLLYPDILLLAKHPTYTSPNISTSASRLYGNRMKERGTTYEPASSSEAGIVLLAAGHGPTRSAYHAEWRASLREQRQKRRLPKFLSTQPATAVENRRTTIKQQIERMIEDTTNSPYIATRGIGILHHDLLDLLEVNPELDFRVLTNRKRARGERKKFKRAVMDELAERTGTGVKQSELVHTRMIVSDNQRLLVSDADFTRDHLQDSFSAGLYTEYPNTVKQATAMFETAWANAEYLNKS